MKPKHIKAQRQKAVRRLWKRREQLVTAMQQLGYIKLDKPIRNGWFKEIIITHKIDRYKNKAAITEVFSNIEKTFWGSTKAAADRQWLKQTAAHFIYKDFPTISKRQFNKLSPKAQSLCTPFRYKNIRNKWKLRFYIRIPKATYTIKYSRAYVTHRKRIDPLLESEYALIEQQLLKHGFYEADLQRYNYKSYWWYLEDRKKEKLKTKKSLNKLKQEWLGHIKDNVSWERN